MEKISFGGLIQALKGISDAIRGLSLGGGSSVDVSASETSTPLATVFGGGDTDIFSHSFTVPSDEKWLINYACSITGDQTGSSSNVFFGFKVNSGWKGIQAFYVLVGKAQGMTIAYNSVFTAGSHEVKATGWREAGTFTIKGLGSYRNFNYTIQKIKV